MFNFILKALNVSTGVLCVVDIYCLIGGLGFRNARLFMADAFLFILSWLLFEIRNPMIMDSDYDKDRGNV